MSYDDFATADPANAPLDAPILLGADPVLAAAGLLLLLAALLLGWFMGARSRSKEGDAAASIWKAVDEAAKEAMKADDNALKGRAEDLLNVIDRRLGRTLALVGGRRGLGEGVEGLRRAVSGRKPDDPHGHEDADHGDGDDHKEGAHGRHGESPAPTASASTGAVTIVNVIPGATASPVRPGPHEPRRDLTAREQTAALRLAVAAFNEHWRHESARVKAMRAALAELSGRGRAGPDLSHG
jgi:hypothetical protein